MAYQENLDYFYRMAPYAAKASKATGLFPSVILSQWGLETGYGASDLAKKGNNHGGIKYVGQAPASGSYDGSHAKYDSIDRFVEDYIRVINLNYLSHVRGSATPEQAIQAFTTANNGLKYAEDPAYSNKLQSLFTSYGLRGFDSYTGGFGTIDGLIGSVKEKVGSLDSEGMVNYATIGLAAVLLFSLVKSD